LKLVTVLATAAVLALLLGSTPALADSPHTNLSLTLNGAILDAGSSTYYHVGGHLAGAYILGVPVDPSSSVLHYSLTASVSGLSVAGEASFSLASVGQDGSHNYVLGEAPIDSMVPAEEFPLGCTLGVDCTSAIPGVFLGTASVSVVTCHGALQAGHCQTLFHGDLPMQFESAFLNPFGGPIMMASDGGEVVIVATYTQSRVTWAGIQLGGTASGTLAGSPVSGQFGMTVSAVEDLRGGYELDAGSIAFLGMSQPSLNAAGGFVGRSTIPAGTACPPELGFPPGTCQLTGFASKGVFSMTNALGGDLKGSYSTTWTVPAVAFSSTVSATLS
jgi:hypothetical protein